MVSLKPMKCVPKEKRGEAWETGSYTRRTRPARACGGCALVVYPIVPWPVCGMLYRIALRRACGGTDRRSSGQSRSLRTALFAIAGQTLPPGAPWPNSEAVTRRNLVAKEEEVALHTDVPQRCA